MAGSLTRQDVVAILEIVRVLAPLAIAGTDAIVRAIRAIRGTVTEEEIQADLDWLQQDATFRRGQSRIAAGLPPITEGE